jgi:histidyl-tRNA synthetase
MQFDADTVGSSSPAADAEMCMMAADTLEALGIPRGSYVIKVNNRKVLDGVREIVGIEEDSQWIAVMRGIDKLDRLGAGGVRQLLGSGRKDDSGDFTKGAGLSAAAIDVILEAVDPRSALSIQPATAEPNADPEPAAIQGGILWKNPKTLTHNKRSLSESIVFLSGQSELDEIRRLVVTAGYGPDRIRIDPSVVRGLEYYTGAVYEAELLLDTVNEKGEPARFGSVGGGGRYDGLVGRFRGEPVPATGFSIGVSRLQAALAALGKLDDKSEQGPVVVTVFDKDRLADYQRMVQSLRNAGIRAELYLGNPKNMGNQLKYADRRNAPCVIIQGSDEKARGEVQIKDLVEGAKAAAAIASHQEWRETRPAQFSCKEDELVARVREVLARHRDD